MFSHSLTLYRRALFVSARTRVCVCLSDVAPNSDFVFGVLQIYDDICGRYLDVVCVCAGSQPQQAAFFMRSVFGIISRFSSMAFYVDCRFCWLLDGNHHYHHQFDQKLRPVQTADQKKTDTSRER